jgi:hypothetical protein
MKSGNTSFTKKSRNMVDDEDILIIFVIRLLPAQRQALQMERLSNEEMVNFWLNTFYFHTDLRRLRTSELILNHGFTRECARQQLEGYLDRFLRYSRQLGVEALGVLWKGIFPKGSLHYLLADHTYEEIRPLLTE